jgi:hypothetical protein
VVYAKNERNQKGNRERQSKEINKKGRESGGKGKRRENNQLMN